MKKRLPRMAAPLGIERSYQLQLRKITSRVRDIVRVNIVDALPAIMSDTELLRPRTDSERLDVITPQNVAELFEATNISITEQIPDFELSRIAEAKGTEVSAWNKAQLAKVIRSGLGIDVFQSEPWLAEELEIFVTNNVNLIKSNNAAFLSQTENIVFDGMRRGLRHEEIAKQILGNSKDELGHVSKFKNAKNRANLIARDQVNKLNGQLNGLRQRNAGITKYIWRTNIDGRERASHNSWNSQTFTWAKGSPIGTNPGDEIQCRCYAEPDLSDLLN